MNQLRSILHLRIAFQVDPFVRSQLLVLLKYFENACETIHRVAIEYKCSHSAGLQLLTYRMLTPETGPGLPSQYSVRAINRVSHQLRMRRRNLPDPYPSHSIDLDHHSCSLHKATSQIRITPPDARGRLQRKGLTVRVILGPLRTKDLETWSSHHLLGAYLVIPTEGPVVLHARLTPKPI